MRSWECRTQRMFNNLTKQNQKPGFLFCSIRSLKEPSFQSAVFSIQVPASRVRHSKSSVQSPESSVQSPKSILKRPTLAYRVQKFRYAHFITQTCRDFFLYIIFWNKDLQHLHTWINKTIWRSSQIYSCKLSTNKQIKPLQEIPKFSWKLLINK